MAKSLTAYRLEKYMDIDTFVKYVGVSLRTYYRILKGAPTRFSTMHQIAGALGVHPSEITEFVLPATED